MFLGIKKKKIYFFDMSLGLGLQIKPTTNHNCLTIAIMLICLLFPHKKKIYIFSLFVWKFLNKYKFDS